MATKNYWDELVRWILSQFEDFKQLEIAEKIASFDASALLQMPASELQKIYQNLKIGDFVLERDLIRGAMFEISKADKAVQ